MAIGRRGGSWENLQEKLRTRWSRLTDADLNEIGESQDRLIGILTDRYGIEENEARRQVTAFNEQWELDERQRGEPSPGNLG